MSTAGLAIVFGLFTWWFSTGLIIMLVRMPAKAHVWGMAAASLLSVACLFGLVATRDNTTVAGAFAGFTYAVVVWGWLEMTFLYGYITGPRREPLEPYSTGMKRFHAAFNTVSSHEIAILLAGALLAILSFGAANQVGFWTFLVLWSMRISAKLNLFFGVPNVSVEFLPKHLSYLSSYFDRRRVSLFFPVSVTLSSLVFGVIVHAAATTVDPFQAVALALVATLLGLAIVEHWFLVLPLQDAALWRWALQAVDIGRISSEIAPTVPASSEAVIAARAPVPSGDRLSILSPPRGGLSSVRHDKTNQS
jgi:putative photosynthetic complex assembly protein 2